MLEKSEKEITKKKKHLCKFIIEIKFYVQVFAKYFIYESNDIYMNKQKCIVLALGGQKQLP